MKRAFVALCILVMLLAGCGVKLPDNIDLPTQLTGGDPKTLEAATKAAQEYADRRSAEDLAGVWLMYTKDVRSAISQQDYVRLNTTCRSSLENIPLKAVGVRMDDNEHAVVRLGALGFQVTYNMIYQDGKWLVPPDDRFAGELSKPVDAIIAERKAAGRCGNPAFPSSSPTPPTQIPPAPIQPPPTTQIPPAPIQPPPTTPSTSDVSGAGTGGTGRLVAVRLGPRDDYDRLVLEFLDGVPSYTIGYRPLPAHADGSGNEIPLPGANALVQATFTGATGSGWGDGPRTYFGPSTVTADTAVVTEAKAAGDFEALLTWVIGLRSEVPFRVSVLDGPPRLVVDFQH